MSMLCPENPLGGTSIVNAERQHRIQSNGTDLVKTPLVIRHKQKCAQKVHFEVLCKTDNLKIKDYVL